MEEVLKEQMDYMERTLRNYYYLKKEAQKLKKEAFILEMKIKEEREVNGISYDAKTGTYKYNNTDTPYIIQLIHEQQSCDLDAIHYDTMANELDKRNKINKRLSAISNDNKRTIKFICDNGMSLSAYAIAESVSRQAIGDRLESALKAMIEVE